MSREMALNGFKRVLIGLDGLQSEMCKVQMLLIFSRHKYVKTLKWQERVASSLCNTSVCAWLCVSIQFVQTMPKEGSLSLMSTQVTLQCLEFAVMLTSLLGFNLRSRLTVYLPWRQQPDPMGSFRQTLTHTTSTTLTHGKKLSSCICPGQIASAIFKPLESINCQISHKFKAESVASFHSVA